MYTKWAYCKTCGKKTKFEKKGMRHMLHIALSFLTFGMWVPVYGFLGVCALGGNGWKCSECGENLE